MFNKRFFKNKCKSGKFCRFELVQVYFHIAFQNKQTLRSMPLFLWYPIRARRTFRCGCHRRGDKLTQWVVLYSFVLFFIFDEPPCKIFRCLNVYRIQFYLDNWIFCFFPSLIQALCYVQLRYYFAGNRCLEAFPGWLKVCVQSLVLSFRVTAPCENEISHSAHFYA